MNKYAYTMKVAKKIITVPSQMWYLTAASNSIPSNRNTANPLKIGSRSKAKQASDSKPNLVATFNTSIASRVTNNWSINYSQT